MARIFLNGNLGLFTKGETEFEITVPNVKKLFVELGERFPDLKPHLEEGIAVAIDGQVFQDAWLEPVGSNSEVHIFPGIGGG